MSLPPVAVGEKSGRPYHPDGDFVGKGAQGSVFPASGPTGAVMVKVFEEPETSDFEKIRVLTRILHPITLGARPREVVLDATTKKPLGFAMDPVAGENFKSLVDDGFLEGLTIRESLRLSESFVAVAHQLEGVPQFAHVDFSKQNFAVGGDLSVRTYDLDSGWVFGARSVWGRKKDYSGVVGTEGFIDPERLNSPDLPPTSGSVLFALAVMIFEITHGIHPSLPEVALEHQGLTENHFVKSRVFPKYIRDPRYGVPEYLPQSKRIPKAVDEALESAFLNGPSRRPTASQWLAILGASRPRRVWSFPTISLPSFRRTAAIGLVACTVAAAPLVWREIGKILPPPNANPVPRPLVNKPLQQPIGGPLDDSND